MLDLDTCVAFITNKTAKQIANAFNERLVKLGVTRVQWIALYYLGREESISQSELSEKMDLADSSVARLIDRMERGKLVLREKNGEDRRVTYIRLTDKGEQLRAELLPEGDKVSDIVSKDISTEEVEIFKKVLQKMRENAEEI